MPTNDECIFGTRNYDAIQSLTTLVHANATQLAVLSGNVATLVRAMEEQDSFEVRIKVLEGRHKFYISSIVLLIITIAGAVVQGYMTMPAKP